MNGEEMNLVASAILAWSRLLRRGCPLLGWGLRGLTWGGLVAVSGWRLIAVLGWRLIAVVVLWRCITGILLEPEIGLRVAVKVASNSRGRRRRGPGPGRGHRRSSSCGVIIVPAVGLRRCRRLPRERGRSELREQMIVRRGNFRVIEAARQKDERLYRTKKKWVAALPMEQLESSWTEGLGFGIH